MFYFKAPEAAKVASALVSLVGAWLAVGPSVTKPSGDDDADGAP